MTKPLTPGQQRTAKALAARKMNAQIRAADRLRALGWTCTPPGETPPYLVVREVVYADPCTENGAGQCITPGHNHP